MIKLKRGLKTGRPKFFDICHVILICLVFGAMPVKLYANCTPTFKYLDGWLGADGAYSVALPKHETLWLFGDSFINMKKPDTRQGATMVSNTVALSQCRAGKFYIHYYWHTSAENKPQAFLNPADKNIKYWPHDGFYYHGRVYVFWSRIQVVKTHGPFNFKGIGTVLTTINPFKSSNPNHWITHIQNLHTGDRLFPGVAAVVKAPYVYLWGVLDGGKFSETHPIILQRILLTQLSHAAQAIQTLTQSGWRSQVGWRKAKIIVPTAATEMSVLYNTKRKQWQMTYSVFPAAIMQRTSAQLMGPWSKPRLLFSPKIKVKGQFCYAAKAHAQFIDSAGNARITYVCNDFDFGTLIDNLMLYHPVLVPEVAP